MFKYKSVLSPLALSLSLALSASAFAGQHPQSGDKGMRQVFKQLQLSNTQREDMRQLGKQNRQDRDVYTEDMQDLTDNVKALLQSAVWDQQGVESALSQRQVLRTTLALQKAQHKHQLWQLLSAEQQAEFIQLNKQGEHKKRGSRNRARLLKGLDLSEAQTAAVTEIRAQAQNSQEHSKARLKDFKLAEQALIHAEIFSPSDWLALDAKYQQDFLGMALTSAKSKHAVWQLLSPAQQTQLKKKMSKHKAKRPQGKKGDRTIT